MPTTTPAARNAATVQAIRSYFWERKSDLDGAALASFAAFADFTSAVLDAFYYDEVPGLNRSLGPRHAAALLKELNAELEAEAPHCRHCRLLLSERDAKIETARAA